MSDSDDGVADTDQMSPSSTWGQLMRDVVPFSNAVVHPVRQRGGWRNKFITDQSRFGNILPTIDFEDWAWDYFYYWEVEGINLEEDSDENTHKHFDRVSAGDPSFRDIPTFFGESVVIGVLHFNHKPTDFPPQGKGYYTLQDGIVTQPNGTGYYLIDRYRYKWGRPTELSVTI